MSRESLEQTVSSIVYKHRRTGRLYALVIKAKLELSGEEMVVYRSLKSGRVWVRPSAEFFDGRYLPTTVATTREEAAEWAHV